MRTPGVDAERWDDTDWDFCHEALAQLVADPSADRSPRGARTNLSVDAAAPNQMPARRTRNDRCRPDSRACRKPSIATLLRASLRPPATARRAERLLRQNEFLQPNLVGQTPGRNAVGDHLPLVAFVEDARRGDQFKLVPVLQDVAAH